MQNPSHKLDTMPRKPRYRTEETLKKAMTLFWKRGYQGASLKHIEKALDMRPGSVYAAFGSKENLFGLALDAYGDQMQARLDAALDAEEGALDGLRRYFRDLAGACTLPGDDAIPVPACMLVKTLLEVNDEDTALRRRANRLLDALEAQITRVLEKARQVGELKPDVDVARLARLLQTQIIGLRAFAQREVDAAHVRELAEDIVAVLDDYARAAGKPGGH